MSIQTEAIALIKARGLTERTRRLLTFKALHRETYYVDLGLGPWELDQDAEKRKISIRRRQPDTQLGLLPAAADRLVDKLVGQARLPTIELDDGAERRPRGADLPDHLQLLSDTLWEGLRLAKALHLPTVDLLRGSCVLGFARTAPGVWEALYLDTAWCDAVFVSQVRTPRARRYAAELAKVANVVVPSDTDGPHLPAPEGARSDDVAFVRYQWQAAEEDREREGTPKGSTEWHRRDYLPDAIVEYEPQIVLDQADRMPAEWLPKPVEPHGWGVLPIVWVRSRGAEPGELEGPAFYTPSAVSLAVDADYTASMEGDSTRYNCSPLLALLDLVDRARQEGNIAGIAGADEVDTGPKAVLELSSARDKTGRIELVETTGAAAEAARELVSRRATQLARATGMLEHDQSEAAGTLSGAALERMLEPVIARVEAYRGELTEGIQLLVAKLARAMHVDGELPTADISASLTWPRVIAMTAQDAQEWSTALGAATGAGILSTETATRVLATQLELDDPEAEVELVRAESEQAMQAALEMAQRGAEGNDDEEPDEDDGEE